jgi:hypothetical protein
MSCSPQFSAFDIERRSTSFLGGRTANQLETSMTTHSLPSAPWRTASFADSSDATSAENSALGEHVSMCRKCSGSLFAVRRGAESMHGFFAGRFVTTLVLIAVIVGLASLAL